jgi:alpha-beta hydrolase superfamily lysophospholipase
MLPVAEGDAVSVLVVDWAQGPIPGVTTLPFAPPMSMPIDLASAAAAYERYAVPETGQIFYEAGFANFHFNPPTEVHFKNAGRAPLLIVGAEKDHTVPASLARKQYEKYGRSPASTDFLEFEGRPHLLMSAEGWEEVAAAIDSWLDGVLDAPISPASSAPA